MRNPKTLRRYRELCEERCHIDCHRYDCFFAFGDKQFEEGLKQIRPLREGEKICSAGAGLYGTRDGLDRYFAAHDDFDKRIAAECDPQEVYFHEYNNHECQISWDGDEPAYQIIVRLWGEDTAQKIQRVS